jgi:hypothetical protein
VGRIGVTNRVKTEFFHKLDERQISGRRDICSQRKQTRSRAMARKLRVQYPAHMSLESWVLSLESASSAQSAVHSPQSKGKSCKQKGGRRKAVIGNR